MRFFFTFTPSIMRIPPMRIILCDLDIGSRRLFFTRNQLTKQKKYVNRLKSISLDNYPGTA